MHKWLSAHPESEPEPRVHLSLQQCNVGHRWNLHTDGACNGVIHSRGVDPADGDHQQAEHPQDSPREHCYHDRPAWLGVSCCSGPHASTVYPTVVHIVEKYPRQRRERLRIPRHLCHDSYQPVWCCAGFHLFLWRSGLVAEPEAKPEGNVCKDPARLQKPSRRGAVAALLSSVPSPSQTETRHSVQPLTISPVELKLGTNYGPWEVYLLLWEERVGRGKRGSVRDQRGVRWALWRPAKGQGGILLHRARRAEVKKDQHQIGTRGVEYWLREEQRGTRERAPLYQARRAEERDQHYAGNQMGANWGANTRVGVQHVALEDPVWSPEDVRCWALALRSGCKGGILRDREGCRIEFPMSGSHFMCVLQWWDAVGPTWCWVLVFGSSSWGSFNLYE